MKKVKPALLKQGDKIGIVSPARFINPSEIEGALEWLKQRGFIPILGKHVFDSLNQFAGKDEDRASDIMDFITDPEISCIWSTRGGYGSIRLLPYLSGEKLTKSPKWFVGFSDVTVFHSWLHQKLNLQSIHGPMLFSWNDTPESAESFSALEQLLVTGKIEYQYEAHPASNTEEMSGILVGGNLSMLYSLRGTNLDLTVRNKILFLEDVDEYLYHLDRMMQNFRLAGWLNEISGLLIGGMNEMNDNAVPFGQSPEEIISRLAGEYGLPVIFGHPAGHLDRNLPLVFGEEISLRQTGDKVNCTQ